LSKDALHRSWRGDTTAGTAAGKGRGVPHERSHRGTAASDCSAHSETQRCSIRRRDFGTDNGASHDRSSHGETRHGQSNDAVTDNRGADDAGTEHSAAVHRGANDAAADWTADDRGSQHRTADYARTNDGCANHRATERSSHHRRDDAATGNNPGPGDPAAANGGDRASGHRRVARTVVPSRALVGSVDGVTQWCRADEFPGTRRCLLHGAGTG
jgi:hypothetical protein